MTHIYLTWRSNAAMARELHAVADRIYNSPADGAAIVILPGVIAIASDAGKWMYVSEQAEAKGLEMVNAELVRRFGSPGVTGQ